MEEKVHTHFPKSEGKNQSGKMDNEIFIMVSFFLDFHEIEGRKVRCIIVIYEIRLTMSHLFCVDKLMSLSPNVVICSRLCFVIFIKIFDMKDPHFSEVNQVNPTVLIFILHFHISVEGKADLADEGQLLIFGCIDNEALT